MKPILSRCSKYYFFALINVSYLTEKGDRGSHIFFTTIKAACVAQIYFFLRSLKGQILRQTHGCSVCPGNFFPILASWFFWSRCTTCTNIRYLVSISSVWEFLLGWVQNLFFLAKSKCSKAIIVFYE